jgi:hypothetical protein
MISLPDQARAALTLLIKGDRPVPLRAEELCRDPEHPLAATHRALFERLGGHAAVAVPLRTRQRSYGVLTVARAEDNSAHQIEAIGVPEQTGSLSLLRDGTVLGPADYFEPVGIREF